MWLVPIAISALPDRAQTSARTILARATCLPDTASDVHWRRTNIQTAGATRKIELKPIFVMHTLVVVARPAASMN